MSMTDNIAIFQKYKLSNGVPERLSQTLYDTLVVPTAGQTQLQFFQTPLGQGKSAQSGNANNPKCKADTNMQFAGALPKGLAYMTESIEVDFTPGSSAADANTFAIISPVAWNATAAATLTAGVDDVSAFYNGGWLELLIMQKTYLTEGPLYRFPPKAHIDVRAAVASNSATTAEAVVARSFADGKQYYLEVPMPIEENQSFAVTLNWPVAIATPSTKNGRCQVILGGQMFRVSQ